MDDPEDLCSVKHVKYFGRLKFNMPLLPPTTIASRSEITSLAAKSRASFGGTTFNNYVKSVRITNKMTVMNRLAPIGLEPIMFLKLPIILCFKEMPQYSAYYAQIMLHKFKSVDMLSILSSNYNLISNITCLWT